MSDKAFHGNYKPQAPLYKFVYTQDPPKKSRLKDSPVWIKLMEFRRVILGSENLAYTIIFIDFVAHLLLAILHFANRAYPYIEPLRASYIFRFLIAYTPWSLFHAAILVLYVVSAFKGEKMIVFTVTLSWYLWLSWTLLMFFWGFAAPITLVPPTMGLVMCLLAWFSRRVWLEKEG